MPRFAIVPVASAPEESGKVFPDKTWSIVAVPLVGHEFDEPALAFGLSLLVTLAGVAASAFVLLLPISEALQAARFKAIVISKDGPQSFNRCSFFFIILSSFLNLFKRLFSFLQ